MAAITGFLDQWVFGHDRAAMLTAQIPAADAEQAAARQRQHDHLTADLARIATAQAQPDDLAAAATPDQDASLLDELPYLVGQLADAPADLVEALISALDIQILCSWHCVITVAIQQASGCCAWSAGCAAGQAAGRAGDDADAGG